MGGVAIILNLVIPSISTTIWALLLAPAVSVVVFRGYYAPIEKISIVMIWAVHFVDTHFRGDATENSLCFFMG